MANSDLSIRLGVDGERDFKNALRDINQSFKVLGSEMTLISSQFDKNDKSVAALTSRNTVLRKEIDAQKEKVETLKNALDNAATSFGDNDKRTQNWQIQLNKAQAELNGMERELGENDNETAIKPHKHTVYKLSIACFVARLSLNSAKRYSAELKNILRNLNEGT